MDLVLELHEKARRRGKRVVLPEAADERVVQAAGRLASEGLVQPVLVEARGRQKEATVQRHQHDFTCANVLGDSRPVSSPASRMRS